MSKAIFESSTITAWTNTIGALQAIEKIPQLNFKGLHAGRINVHSKPPHAHWKELFQRPKTHYRVLCVLDRASYWYLNKGWPTRWHLLYYILLNMFQTLIRPSSGASEYLLCCVGWLEACWCGSAYTRIPHRQQTIPVHNISTPQVSLHNTTSTR